MGKVLQKLDDLKGMKLNRGNRSRENRKGKKKNALYIKKIICLTYKNDLVDLIA